VDWVYQMDCPEDWRAYNHRVGRTARNHKVGRAMMTLLPSEEAAMIKQLTVRRFRLTKDAVDTDDLPSVQKKLQACVAADTELKGSAQRAFTAYLKSTYMMKDKSVFDAFALDTGAFAVSFGLVVPPRVRFLQRRQKKMDEEDNKGNVVDKTKLESVVDHMKSECVVEKTHSENVEGRVKARSKKDQFVFEMSDDSDDDDVGENMLTCKRKDHGLEGGGEVDEVNGEDLPQPEDLGQKKIKTVTKAALAKKALKKNFQINERIQFGEDGETVLKGQSAHKDSDIGKKYESEAAQTAGIDISAAREMIKAEDVFDRRKEREQQKERNKEKKRKLKEAKGKRMSGTTQKAEEGKEEDDPDEGPNLDWLPDPDKVYGKEVGDSSNSESDEEEEYGKRKWKPPKKKKEAAAKKQKLSRVDDEEESEDDSSGNLEYLADQEELALRLLTGR
jgi:ATP-dependent RNA helicase DDX10/DBP4